MHFDSLSPLLKIKNLTCCVVCCALRWISHGEQLGEHHILSKTGFFDGSYHLPCIIRDPRPSADVSRGTAVTQ